MIIRPYRRNVGNYVSPSRMPFGAHRDELVERVLFEYPDYVCWFYSEGLGKQYPAVHARLSKCCEKFDALPYANARCSGMIDGSRCKKPIIRYTLIPTSSVPQFWCAECQPEQTIGEEYFESSSYFGGINHVWRAGGNRVDATRNFMKLMAQAKGLPERPDDTQIIKFIHGSDAVLLDDDA